MLLDTSGLFSYFDKRDAHHGDAVTFFAAAAARLTHNYVLAEFVPLCYARGLDRNGTLAFVTDLLDNTHVEVVWVDQFLHRTALSFLQSRLDKTYSLCDAVSFLIMRQGRIREALTTDRHFAQEGFQRLLKP
jgi:predicted nucleic acid-binding protein